MTPEAMRHTCGEEHGKVITRLDGLDRHNEAQDARLDAHQAWLQRMAEALQSHCGSSALHVTRSEMDAFKGIIHERDRKADEKLDAIREAIAKANTERAVERAGWSRSDKLWQAVAPAVAVIAAAIIALWK